MAQTKRTKTAKAKSVARAEADPLGPTVLLSGEEQGVYDRLAAQITAAVNPQDVIEAIWVRDVIDLVWEVMRLRRLKGSFLRSCEWQVVAKVLGSLISYRDADVLARKRHKGDPDAVRTVDIILADAGLTIDAATAHTLTIRLDEVERIERMIALAEARKNAALRELDRHRAALAERLRRAADEVQDAEFTELPPADDERLKRYPLEEDERLGWLPAKNA